jgi:hypothetical protein
MTTETFDADTFMQTATDGEMSTQVEVCPAGEFLAAIESIEVDSFQGKKDPTKTYRKMRVKWSIDDAAVKEKLGRSVVSANQDIFLDITADGALDRGRGKNVTLGRLREAVGQNTPGKPWAPNMLVGCPARVRVEHESGNTGVFAKVVDVVSA